MAGLTKAPTVRVDGRLMELDEDATYTPGAGRLVLRVRGKPKVEIELR